MARPLRIAYPNAVYHVMGRGNEAGRIFQDDTDRKKFLSCLEATIDRHGIIVHAWCLMENHYHLVVETPQSNIARALQYLNAAYTAYHNARHHRVGHLFQGRYKAILVEKDAYLHEVSRYIHMNPVRAGLVTRPEEYEWSSYLQFVGKKKPDRTVHTEPILKMFSRNAARARRMYREFVDESPRDDKTRMESLIHGGMVLGREGFVCWVRDTFLSVQTPDRDQPQIRALQKGPGIADMERLVQKKVRDEGHGRNVTIYLVRKHTGHTLKAIAEHFGGLKDSGVCQICRRMEERRKTDKKLDHLLRSFGDLSKVEI